MAMPDQKLMQKLGLGTTQAEWLANLALDTRLERMFLVGPYSVVIYTPSQSGIAVPAAVQPNQRLLLVGPVDGPAAIVSIFVTMSSRVFTLGMELDGTKFDFSMAAIIAGEVDAPFSMGAFTTKVDHANSLFVAGFNTGHPAGLPFYDNARLSVQNNDTAAINLVNFIVVARFAEPLGPVQVAALTRERQRREGRG